MVKQNPVRIRQRKTPSTLTHRVSHVSMHHEGPLPMASEYAAYERVHKGSANRILKMAEKALDAETNHLKVHGAIELISMLSGRLFMYALLAVAFVLALKGKQAEAAFAALPPLATGFAGAYRTITESKSKPKKKSKS